jgi:hypothetical protein
VKQFFLDCYIGSENFMTVLTNPLRGSDRVTCSQFLQAFDEIQIKSLDALVLYMGESPSHKKTATMQKIVCKA